MAKTLNITLYTPHAKQQEIHNSPARFKVANLGRRIGKSTFAQNYIIHPGPRGAVDWPIAGAFEKIGRYWIIAPTYTQAKSVYWNGLLFSKDPGNTTAIPKELIEKVNGSELVVTLINGSTIELKGADNPDSLRGAEAQGIVLDEFAFWDHPDAWELVLQPMLSTTNGWALFLSTPNGFNHFFDLAEYAKKAKNWSYHHGTIYDNPNIDDAEKQRIEEEFDEDTFAQEYLAEFRKMKGLVYPEFRREIHIFNPMDEKDCLAKIGKKSIPLGGSWHLGVDPGLRDELAVAIIFVDYENNWYIMDEIYERNLNTEEAFRLIRQKMGNRYFSTRVADSAAATFIKDMNDIHKFGLVPVEKKKDSINEGIRLVRELLKVREGTGRPKLFVAAHCQNWVQEVESYRYKEEELDRNPDPKPIDANNHLMDATRYIRLFLHLPVQKPRDRRRKLYHEVTGRFIGYEDNNYQVNEDFYNEW